MRSAFLFVLGLVATAAVTMGACAQASGEFEESGDGGGSSKGNTSSSGDTSSSTSTAGSGGGMATSSSAGQGGGSSSSSTTSGGGGSGCPGSPCDVVTQCGCGVDEQCSLDGTLAIGCVPEGTVAQGKACDAVNNCAPGLLCVTPADANVSLCEKFCDNDNQCVAPGGLCVLTLSDGMGGTLAGVTLCTENCDPANAASCPVAGTGCQVAQENAGLMRFFTLCAAAGAAGQNANCMANADCAPGSGCFNTGGASDVCLKYCKVNSPVCPGVAQCVPIQVNMEDVIIGNEQYGACL